jgi:DNA-binding CsgD family transcriptional regulator
LLAEDSGSQAITSRHADWFADVAAALRALVRRGRMNDAIAAYRADQANVTAAMRHRLDVLDYAGAARIACDLVTIWEELGRLGFQREWFADLLAAATAHGVDDLPAEAYMTSAYLALVQRKGTAVDTEVQRLDATIAHARAAGDDQALVRGLAFMALAVTAHGSVPRAILAADEGRAAAERANEPAAAAEFTMWRAMLAHLAGDLATAYSHGGDALERARSLGENRLIVRTSLLFTSMPRIAGERGVDLPALDELLTLARSNGNVLDEFYVVTQLAMREAMRGDARLAFPLVHDGLVMARRTGALELELVCLVVVASAAFRSGDDRAGARFHGSIAPHAATLPMVMPPSAVTRYEELVAQRRAVLGETIFDRRVGSARARSWAAEVAAASQYTARRARREGAGALTPRERDVLGELVAGATNKDIAAALGMTAKTVMHHCAAIYRKLDVRTRAEAASYALRHGLVDADEPGDA